MTATQRIMLASLLAENLEPSAPIIIPSEDVIKVLTSTPCACTTHVGACSACRVAGATESYLLGIGILKGPIKLD